VTEKYWTGCHEEISHHKKVPTDIHSETTVKKIIGTEE
jgi:hypothetical protein